MLFAECVDYIIEYAPVINYWKALGEGNLNISQAAIENKESPSKILVAIGCTNNLWGKTIINEILSKEKATSDFWKRRLRWYEGRDRVTLRRLYNQHL